MSDQSNNPNENAVPGDGGPALGAEPGSESTGQGGRRRDPLEDIAAKIDAALAELRPKLRSAISELDQKVDAALGDAKARARPKVDELVTELQPKLDSLISRVQSALDGLKRDLEGRADRAEARQGTAEADAAGHWPEMKEDTRPADPPMEKPFGPRSGAGESSGPSSSGTPGAPPAPGGPGEPEGGAPV